MPKYSTTAKGVESPFVKRTASPVKVGVTEFTVYIRGAAGKWVASVAGTEGEGKTLDAAVDAAVAAREALDTARNKAAVVALVPAQEVDVPTVAEIEAEETSAPVKVKRDKPAKGKSKGKKAKVAEAVKEGTDVKAPVPAETPKMTMGKVAALVSSAYRTSAGATTRAMAREITGAQAVVIIVKARDAITEDVAAALRDGVDADAVNRLGGYALKLIGHHLAVIGKGGTKLTSVQNKRARAKLGKIVASAA